MRLRAIRSRLRRTPHSERHIRNSPLPTNEWAELMRLQWNGVRRRSLTKRSRSFGVWAGLTWWFPQVPKGEGPGAPQRQQNAAALSARELVEMVVSQVPKGE